MQGNPTLNTSPLDPAVEAQVDAIYRAVTARHAERAQDSRKAQQRMLADFCQYKLAQLRAGVHWNACLCRACISGLVYEDTKRMCPDGLGRFWSGFFGVNPQASTNPTDYPGQVFKTV